MKRSLVDLYVQRQVHGEFYQRFLEHITPKQRKDWETILVGLRAADPGKTDKELYESFEVGILAR